MSESELERLTRLAKEIAASVRPFAVVAGEAWLAGYRAAQEQAAKVVDDVCNPDSTSDLSEGASEAYNAGPCQRTVNERLKSWGEFVAAAIRAMTPE